MEPRGDYEHATALWVRHPWTPQGTKHVERRPRDTKISKNMASKVQKSIKKTPTFMKKLSPGRMFQSKSDPSPLNQAQVVPSHHQAVRDA